MSKIFKYPLDVTGTQTVMLPKGGKSLTVQVQHGVPCLWAAVDPEQGLEAIVIGIYGTGHELLDKAQRMNYLGTFQLDDGDFIGHVFELR